MALNAGTVFEVRTTGNAANSGGFYNRTDGTSVDRSQSDSPHATLTAAKSKLNAANAAIVDVHADDYTVLAGDVGNLLNISGGTATAGFYEIISADTENNRWTLDRSAGSTEQTVAGRMGGAIVSIDVAASLVVASNTIYVKTGTYNEEVTSQTVAGAAGTQITVEGYKTTRGDAPQGTDRPLIDGQSTRANCIDLDTNYWVWKHLRVANATAAGISYGAGGDNHLFINVKSSNNGAAGFEGDEIPTYFGCEANNNTVGFSVNDDSAGFNFCYSHDNSSYGFNTRGPVFVCCIGETNGNTGLRSSSFGGSAINSIAYNNTGSGVDGFDFTQGNNALTPRLFLNNIMKDNADRPANFSSGKGYWWIDYNCYHGNGTNSFLDWTGGANDITTDPAFTNAAGGDFSLGAASPCKDTGYPGTSMAGATV